MFDTSVVNVANKLEYASLILFDEVSIKRLRSYIVKFNIQEITRSFDNHVDWADFTIKWGYFMSVKPKIFLLQLYRLFQFFAKFFQIFLSIIYLT